MLYQPHKGRSLNASKPVRIYRNLNKPGVVYSLAQGGQVIGYCTEFALRNCVCTVNENARQRVVRNQVREVHAWIEGYVTETAEATSFRLSYNPYKFPHFYKVGTGEPVHSGAYMLFNATGVHVKPAQTLF